MKRPFTKNLRLAIFLPALCIAGAASAQYNQAYQVMDQNNLSVRINMGGDLFSDPWTFKSGFEAPKGSGKSPIYTSALWIGGLEQKTLHMAAMTYRQSGQDFFPGPLDTTDASAGQNVKEWDKIFYVEKKQIDQFRANGTLHQNLTSWPGNAAGTRYTNMMAPYVDVDQDNKYDISKGDYPAIMGDAMSWWVFNDMADLHSESKGLPMGVEVHGSAWMYDRPQDTALHNTIFIRYEIYNRSKTRYDSVYVGLLNDYDLGYAFDDYVGCDPQRNGVFVYNGTDNDNGTVGYGNKIPVLSMVYLDQKMSNFIKYDNNFTTMGNPQTPADHYHYLQARWKDGSCLTKGGNGYGGAECTSYMYPGWPYEESEWSLGQDKTPAGDMRGLSGTGPFSLNAGEKYSFTVAFIFSQTPNGSTRENLALMRRQMDHITKGYKNGDFEQSGISEDEISSLMHIYPNPAQDMLHLNWKGAQPGQLSICDLNGRMVLSQAIFPANGSTQGISLQNIPAGIYVLSLNTREGIVTKKIVVNK